MKSHSLASWLGIVLVAALVLLNGFVKSRPVDKPRLTGTVITAGSPTPEMIITRKPVVTVTPPAYP